MIAPIVASSPQLTSTGGLDSGDRSDMVRVMLRSEGPGVIEVAELDVPRVAVYVGKPVRLDCWHGMEKHSGFAVHGDIDIIPDGVASRWEMKGVDKAFVISLSRHALRQVAAASGVNSSSANVA